MKKLFFMYVRSFWSRGQVITLMGAFMASFCRFGIFLPTPEAKLFFDQIGDLFQNNALHIPRELLDTKVTTRVMRTFLYISAY